MTYPLPLSTNPRETARHYISASEDSIKSMLSAVGLTKLEDLYQHLPASIHYNQEFNFQEETPYNELPNKLQAVASKNKPCISFLGDGLPHYKQHSIVGSIASIRNLTTAYTPYQPERSQGTLITHWIYQCQLAQLTGFEAINTSLYERSTAIFEAICCAIRLHRKATTVLVSAGLFPGDIEVLDTLTQETEITLEYYSLDKQKGCTDYEKLKERATALGDNLAAIVYPQVNHFGLLEDVNKLTNLAHTLKAKAIAVIDPMLIATEGLKPPCDYGDHGADIIAGEAQHLAISASFGGPGLGLFGVRYNENNKSDVRATPGRFIGKAKDQNERHCFTMVLSTREQHIRKEKATSNICSNQAFLATIAGATLLARGDKGLTEACQTGYIHTQKIVKALLGLDGISLAFPETPFYNECTLQLSKPIHELIKKGSKAGLHIGIDVSSRDPNNRHLLKIACSDIQSEEDCKKLIEFFKQEFPEKETLKDLPTIPDNLLRKTPANLTQFSQDEVTEYYQKIGELNVSPDDACYPLGSCTMKYNPYINDWAANLENFTLIHPQAPLEDAQGCLEILFSIQEWFKQITGLPGVTTQPVAGAQGELVGIKLFQAYHRDHSTEKRDIIFIPKSAHGTNFATAVTAGFKTQGGIIYLQADERGQIDQSDFDTKIKEYGHRLAGIMVTNPNTSGIFETEFANIAQAVHNAGGLVYMDGANMNAIAGWVNLNKMGVDAVHQNLHKTWSIPHGGGGPGDGIVAVSERLLDYLPGTQITYQDNQYNIKRAKKSIGSFHRHWGNFAHKVRCYTYISRLGKQGIQRMSAVAVLSARYLWQELSRHYPTLPKGAENIPRMHEFILTLSDTDFEALEKAGIPKASAIPSTGKLFLDFGFHAPTVAFPEPLGLMIEPTESYTQEELDHFAAVVKSILEIVRNKPGQLKTAPHFTPVDRVDEVDANRNLVLSEVINKLPQFHENRKAAEELRGKGTQKSQILKVS